MQTKTTITRQGQARLVNLAPGADIDHVKREEQERARQLQALNQLAARTSTRRGTR